MKWVGFSVAVVLSLVGRSADAEQLNLSHWGEIMAGVPYAVAMEKGFFRQAGIDITGIIASKGGGTTVRNMLASDLPYAEMAPSAVVSAVRAGFDVKIVNGAVPNCADWILAVRPDSSLHTLKDLAGHKFAITSPKSNTDLLSALIIQKAGVPLDKVERPALGTNTAEIQALEADSVQATYILEPIWSKVSDHFRALARVSDELSPTVQTIGVASTELIKSHPEKVKAVILGRRMGVDYIYAHPEESARILTKYYEGLAPEVSAKAVESLAKLHYWSAGEIGRDTLASTIALLQSVGEVQGKVDLDAIIDKSLLPADLQQKS